MYVKLPFELSFQDYPEPDAWAIVVYFQGCDRHCDGCHNYDLQKISEGTYFSSTELEYLIQKYSILWRTKNIVFTGGDPLLYLQLPSLSTFLNYFGSKYNICIYTGADRDEILNKMGNGKLKSRNYVKYYKGGRYIKQLRIEGKHGKTDNHFQLITRNQFFLDSNFNVISNNGMLRFNHE